VPAWSVADYPHTGGLLSNGGTWYFANLARLEASADPSQFG
jgi:hypothetical protein